MFRALFWGLSISVMLAFLGIGLLRYKEHLRGNDCERTREARYFGCQEVRTLVREADSQGGPMCLCIVEGFNNDRIFWGHIEER